MHPSVPIAFLVHAGKDALSRLHAESGIPEGGLQLHLDAALDWLIRAQDATVDGGVSYGYSLRGGWLPSYRETTGYIVPTMLTAADRLERPDLRRRARRMADWLIEIQNPDGSISNPKYGESGIVFDTGQVIFGLMAAFEDTLDSKYLEAASQAGSWLVTSADDQGLWTRNEHMDTPHVYNSRTAWAALVLAQRVDNPRLTEICRANLDWAIDCQNDNGFFRENAFVRGAAPYTHNISYAVCGLQESGWLLGEDRYVEAARRCSDAVRPLMRKDGFIPGAIDPQGSTVAWYSCLTGQCQFSVAWSRQHEHTSEPALREAAERSLTYVLGKHRISAGEPGVSGGLAGSFPIWGRYAPFSFPNWAAKFLVDATLAVSACDHRPVTESPTTVHRAG